METNNRHSPTDWSLIAYYGILFLSGVEGVLRIGVPHDSKLASQLVYVLFSLLFIVMSPLGVVARWLHIRAAEVVVLCTVSLGSFIHGVLVLYTFGWSGFVTATRLMGVPFVVIPYALVLRRHIISARDIKAVVEQGDE